ncbi:uncharacterized protein TRIADDRAFT_52877 [Trichoplax adhaerens]|uniref:CRESS-DNA virus Rep endonuclease domain-containing protein n=1 Tax=Trichoplax adhaerens TaxID=10228 RepID=B3RMP6_TRIAD|nr:hypothetical protein TRIADDRAFT_52877 [Trichoplax adhaerens]EDV27887.1 hypothetical protein TRIADDRAFT_52877 [Trichoplax adhaerens]|eukprot:XP_002109721.1 hypothetical protein TRIADDRAFT_52877 [Trichoplax adhaerens]
MGKGYCLTLFVGQFDLASKIKTKDQWIIGREICPTTGKEHLQCYYETKCRSDLKAQIKQFKPAHVVRARGSREQNIKYCKKEGNYETNMEIKEDMPPIDRIIPKKHELYSWQKDVLDSMLAQNDRQILWIYDQKGGIGKTAFAYFLIENYNDVIYLNNAKCSDIALATDINIKIIIFDFSRSLQHRINYTILEQLKNGILFSPKYNSKTKKLNYVPRILCISNYEPDLFQLSEDRWIIKNLTKT